MPRRFILAILLGLIAALGTGGSASGVVATSIDSSGPLTMIDISSTLNCAVNHVGDDSGEFYGGSACGTFIAVGGVVYGPESIPAGGVGQIPFTPVSQSAVSGTGSSSNPYKIVTVVDAGGTGVRITETDSYVVGQEAYRTDVSVANGSGAGAIVYRAGDCYLQNSDTGFGQVDDGAVACRAPDANGNPGDRIEQWLPLTGGSSFIEDSFATVWLTIGSQQPFPNSCRCDENIDNGAGLSWSIGAASTTVSHLTTFSPTGIRPVTITMTADSPTAQPGGTNGYTITITNRNASAATLTSLYADLAPGFTYIPGSTSGATAADPAVTGQRLTWSGIVVPAASSASLHFRVRVPSAVGSYTNSASGEAGSFAVAGSGPTATIQVALPQPPPPPPVLTVAGLPPPVPGEKVNAFPVSGKVLVNGKELTSPEQIKVGAVFDTTKGEVRLVTLNGDSNFHDGTFKLLQKPDKNALTELVLRGGSFAGCKSARQASLETPLKARKPVRKLWGNGKGRFRTRARYSSATVRGTEWLTADRCDGSLTTVKQGTVVVRDLVRKKDVTVTAGHSYLAKPRAKPKAKPAKQLPRRRSR